MILSRNKERGFAVVVVLGVVTIIMILIIMQLYGGLFNKSTKKTTLDKQLDELEAHQENTYFKKHGPDGTDPNADKTHSGVMVNKTGDENKTDSVSEQSTETDKKEVGMPTISKKQNKVAQKTPHPNQVIHGTGPGLLKDIGRARRLSKSMNTKVLNDNLIMWKMNNPGKKVTLKNLQKTNFPMPALKPHEEYVIENENIRIQFK